MCSHLFELLVGMAEAPYVMAKYFLLDCKFLGKFVKF